MWETHLALIHFVFRKWSQEWQNFWITAKIVFRDTQNVQKHSKTRPFSTILPPNVVKISGTAQKQCQILIRNTVVFQFVFRNTVLHVHPLLVGVGLIVAWGCSLYSLPWPPTPLVWLLQPFWPIGAKKLKMCFPHCRLGVPEQRFISNLGV